MDLLYQKYASPFSYLQSLMETGNLYKGIDYLFEQSNETKLWELYLHSFPSESYEDWKKKAVTKKEITRTLTDKEVAKQIKKSSDILDNFHL